MDRIKDLPDIFDDVGISSRLTKLDISNRGLDSIPSSIASLTNLTELNLSHNCLNPVPRCIEKLENLSKLSLRSNQLQTLPDFIANLPRLTALNLAKNRFRTIPQIVYSMNNLQFLSFFANQIESISAEISNLSSLRILNLTNNQLRDLPNSILDLSASCELNLENSGLSNTVLDRIRDASLEEHYTGPRMMFSVHEENLEIIANPTINESLDILFSKAGVSNFYGFENNFPKLHQYTLKKHTSQSLSSWLSRLSLMQQSARDGESGLAKKIISYLELAQHNDDFRESFFNLIHGAASTCGDRMALSVLHLGLQYNLTSMDKSNLKKYADFLIHGPWMVDQLEQIAREKVQTLRFVDEIEVFLAYPVKLKNKLDIQIDVSEMLYFRCSGVTIEDLDAAESSIKEMISGNDSIPNILVQRKDWMDALTLNFPDEMSAILEERDIESEKPGDIDYVRILQTYTQKTVDLTKRAIS
ncbi:MAG: hypothetical protein FJZ57_03560 [Chlamydiae bacterium]|nr:hypothetical protein [Chlamydiota bacterium]